MTLHNYFIDSVAIIVIGSVTPTDEELKRILAFARKDASFDPQLVTAYAYYVKNERHFDVQYTAFMEAGILTPETET